MKVKDIYQQTTTLKDKWFDTTFQENIQKNVDKTIALLGKYTKIQKYNDVRETFSHYLFY